MRLFLASQDLGDFSAVLQRMVSGNLRMLLIPNARDYNLVRRRTRIPEKIAFLTAAGFAVQELDLRPYFGKPEALEQTIDAYNPGIIYSVGGDVWFLATAMHESGLDAILRRRLAADDFVYGGSSAGAMVAADNLKLYDCPYSHLAQIQGKYGVPPTVKGLGLIAQYIIPHVDHLDQTTVVKTREQQILAAGATPILLGDPDVYIVEGETSKILKGKK